MSMSSEELRLECLLAAIDRASAHNRGDTASVIEEARTFAAFVTGEGDLENARAFRLRFASGGARADAAA